MSLPLFYLWMLLLPYSWIIAHYIPIIALDKLLAPLLVVIAIPSLLASSYARRSQIIVTFALLFVLVLLKNLSFLSDMPLFLDSIWTDFIKIGYFAIPVLYIQSLHKFHRASWIVVVSAAAGLISVFLVALGWLVLPLQRFEETRIGVETIKKSIGIFPSYGDLAQYVAFSIGVIVLTPGARVPKDIVWVFCKLIFAALFFLGLIGAQSRNLLMSGAASLASLYLLKKVSLLPINRRQVAVVFIFIAGLLGLSFGLFFIGYIIDILSSIGGGLAKDTASARLTQYSHGWSLILENPLLGVSATEYLRNPASIDKIHNLWILLSAKGGLLSSLLFAMILVRIFLRMLKTFDLPGRSKEARVVITYFFVMILSSLFYPALGEAYWALLGIACSLTFIEESISGKRASKRPTGLLLSHKDSSDG